MKKIIMLSCVLMGLLCVQPARAFIGLGIRVFMFYTTYEFVDGLSDSGVSEFVNKYADGPLDAICSFGAGVKRFGKGVRNAVGTFSSEKSDNAFSKSWDVLKNDWDASVETTKKEWKERREKALAQKKQSGKGAHAIG